jgi:hypothetical protein
MRELIDDIEQAMFSPLMGVVFDEVLGPDLVAPFCPKEDAGSVVEQQTAALWLLLRNLQPLPPAASFDPFVVHDPASPRSQQRCDLPVAVAAVLLGDLNDVCGQPYFVILTPRRLTLGRAMLSGHTANPALGHSQLRDGLVDADAASYGAESFPWPSPTG